MIKTVEYDPLKGVAKYRAILASVFGSTTSRFEDIINADLANRLLGEQRLDPGNSGGNHRRLRRRAGFPVVQRAEKYLANHGLRTDKHTVGGTQRDKNRVVDLIVIHAVMPAASKEPGNTQEVLKSFLGKGVCPHFVVAKSGSIFSFAATSKDGNEGIGRSFGHAGQYINARSVGIECIGKVESPDMWKPSAHRSLIDSLAMLTGWLCASLDIPPIHYSKGLFLTTHVDANESSVSGKKKKPGIYGHEQLNPFNTTDENVGRRWAWWWHWEDGVLVRNKKGRIADSGNRLPDRFLDNLPEELRGEKARQRRKELLVEGVGWCPGIYFPWCVCIMCEHELPHADCRRCSACKNGKPYACRSYFMRRVRRYFKMQWLAQWHLSIRMCYTGEDQRAAFHALGRVARKEGIRLSKSASLKP